MVEKSIAKNMRVYASFIDITKAYDSVILGKLWEILHKKGIDHDLILNIKALYYESELVIRENQEERHIKVNTGLKQGCCLSPHLFNLYIEYVNKQAMKTLSQHGIKISEETFLKYIMFADDCALVSHDIEDLEELLEGFQENYRQYGLEINGAKSEIICFSRDNFTPGTKLRIGSTEKNWKESVKYLGCTIENNGSSRNEIKNKCYRARNIINSLNGIWKSHNINLSTKQRIYMTIIEPTVLYGSENWVLNKNHLDIINATEMVAQRKIAKVTRLDKIRNSTVKNRAQAKGNILDRMFKRRFNWTGHLLRMTDNKLPKMAFKYKNSFKNPRGRPRKTWMDTTKEIMRKSGSSWQEVSYLCQDREKFKNYVQDLFC